ncbi:MAG: serine hydrolase domain-containing protein [Opitutaceae bacterium]|jgi:CubicO group peptidase (beta-lactamase class C family)
METYAAMLPRGHRPLFRLISALVLSGAASAYPETPPKTPIPATIPELRRRIEKILEDTHTPGAGIALVGRAGPMWVAGIGLADVAQNRPATEDTLFRIGSISKSFVALSVLKLQQEGRLDLQDTLRSRAPDVEFNNPWEAADPVRIVHLLEHTAGWDDNSPQEGDWNPNPEPTRREGLAFYPRSRTSRWRPGTSFSYSNLGPDVAAYVIEKVTGERFEDYVAATWFKPLGMAGASYFETPEVLSRLAMSYGQGGEAKHPHSNVLLRPAGAIAASPRDMANYVEFYLNRGSFRGVELLPKAAIDRMERPTSTYAAAEGVDIGYGLGNAATTWRNWVFHGHGGGGPGYCADMLYLPEEKVGYALMINCENGAALNQLEGVVRAYLLQHATPPPLPPAGSADEAQMTGYSGWYEPITPRNENSRYLEEILGVTHVTSANGQLFLRDLTNGRFAYVRVKGRLYRRLNNSRSLVLVGDHSDGTLFQTVGGPTFRRMPAYVADLKLGFALATALLMFSSAIFSIVWLPRRLFGDLKGAEYFGVRTDPLLAALFGSAVIALIWNASGNYYARGAGPIWSGTLAMIATNVAHGLFAFFAIRGLSRALRRRRSPMNRLVWWHSFATSLALTVWAVYLSYWGLRGEFAS